MSQFYDPWVHAIQVFATRVVQFLFLSALFGFAAWVVLLEWHFHAPIVLATVGAINGGNDTARVLLGMCLLVGAILTAWLFTWLMMRARLRTGERHHRGTRVMTDE